jgi:hypothetical protein
VDTHLYSTVHLVAECLITNTDNSTLPTAELATDKAKGTEEKADNEGEKNEGEDGDKKETVWACLQASHPRRP